MGRCERADFALDPRKTDAMISDVRSNLSRLRNRIHGDSECFGNAPEDQESRKAIIARFEKVDKNYSGMPTFR